MKCDACTAPALHTVFFPSGRRLYFCEHDRRERLDRRDPGIDFTVEYNRINTVPLGDAVSA